MLTIKFYGVRGSTPCSCDRTRQFGGNTSCVLVSASGQAPLIVDMGTGARYLGHDLITAMKQESQGQSGFEANVLLSHLHWDHVQGLPFFPPLLWPNASVQIFGPIQPNTSLAVEMASLIKPPAFPVSLEELPGQIRFSEVGDQWIELGSYRIRSFSVPHKGPTNGYRIELGTGSLAYVSDHQQPGDGLTNPDEGVVEACAGVDVLIHDAQYDRQEFDLRHDWGHCTIEYAAEVARRAGVKRLVLYHHDPTHDDRWVQEAVKHAQRLVGDEIEVVGAAEGLEITSS